MKLLARALALALVAAPLAAPFPAAAQTAAAPAPVAELVRQVDIPYETFTLPNGLTTVVHTDRKTPVVAVSVWYHVGSKDEPAGQTGFAHLFEHLMFYGSQHVPESYLDAFSKLGATDMNGSTWFDRTNYYETVPTAALERALYMESDRMGWLLPAMDQKRLDAQRGVVQNEKREGDNAPYGLVEYAQLQTLFPAGHPYHHSTIGSMADLDAASLDQVKSWFARKYGPNNAVLVLAGDIDLATARALVTKYFGGIPRGPAVQPATANVPTLSAAKAETIHDKVATTRLYRNWAVPGLTDPDLVPLDVAAQVLGGLASSRLDNTLVKGEKLAVGVSAGIQTFERVSLFEVIADVRPGADATLVGQRLDAILADLIAKGPTADEVQRVVTREVAGRIRGLEMVGGEGGKAVALAEGQLYAGDPAFFRKQLAAYANVTPAQVHAAARKWLTRPVYALTVSPGERTASEEAKATDASTRAPAPGNAAPVITAAGAGDRGPQPPIGGVPDLRFPKVTHDRLSSGVEVIYAQRTAVPVTRISLSFDAGYAADPKAALGTQFLTLNMLDEGTQALNSIQIAEQKERLGASIGASASMDRTFVSLNALSANLAPSLVLLADVVRNPAFDPAELERVRVQQLARIEQEQNDPGALALRTLPPLIYGSQHPYGVPFTGTGEASAVAKVTRSDLLAFRDRWLRPDNMKVFVVSDLPLGQVKPALEAAFGNWTAPAVAKGTKDLSVPVQAARPRVLVLDRPGSPQSLIEAGTVLPLFGSQDILPLLTANDVLGGDTAARLSLDIREQRNWGYGAYSSISRPLGPIPFLVYAPVQTDKTGPALAAVRDNIAAYVTTKGTTAAELERIIASNTLSLPGSFETGGAILSGMQNNELYRRPDDYYNHLAERTRALTAAQIDQAARTAIDPSKLVWVVVGDRAKIDEQLRAVGLPMEYIIRPKP